MNTGTWKAPSTKAEYAIGIDCGVKTGIAVWDCDGKRFIEIKTVKIHRAMDIVRQYHNSGTVKVRVEDARQRKWFGNAGREQLQGAGSIKRDASIWTDFLTDHKIHFELVAPKNNKTKLSKEAFARLSKYTGLTSVHGRDSGMLVIGM